MSDANSPTRRMRGDQLMHPALIQLVRFQTDASMRRLYDVIRTPKRRLLVITSVCLGLFWLSQAIIGIWLRPAADPENLVCWIPAAMLFYSVWHLFKLLTRTPEPPFHWTTAEEELLHGAPLTRLQLIVYRLSSLAIAAVVKSICFSLIMIPDVHSLGSAFVGMLCGLLFIEGIRLIIELSIHAMNSRERWLLRLAFLIPATVLVASIAQACWPLLDHDLVSSVDKPQLTGSLGAVFISVLQEPPASWLLLPFQPFTQTIMAPFGSVAFVFSAATSLACVIGMAVAIIFLDRFTENRRRTLESLCWHQHNTRNVATMFASQTFWQTTATAFASATARLIGPVAWRQLLGAWHYRVTVLFSLGIPTLLCCYPMTTNAHPDTMLFHIVGGLVFYTFLLLPSALILDFRRDIDRISVLKALPLSPLRITLGQLTAPVLLASSFQCAVLLIAWRSGSVSFVQAIASMSVLVPFNVLNFSLENFLFLASPYRHNAEGMMVFVRTILTFTAKGILFSIAFAITIAWALFAVRFAAAHSLPARIGQLLFVGGLWLIVAGTALQLIRALSRRFDCFDVTLDTPANISS